MSVRKIGMSHGRNITGRVPISNGGVVAFESSLEKDFVLTCLFDGATDIEDQPLSVALRPGRYVPDFLVTWPGPRPRELVEVKPSDVLRQRHTMLEPKFSEARKLAAERGWVFRVVTDQDIRTPRLTSIRFLLPFRHRSSDPGKRARITACLRDGPATIEQLLSAAFSNGGDRVQALPALWSLVANRRVGIDLARPLTNQSLVWLMEE